MTLIVLSRESIANLKHSKDRSALIDIDDLRITKTETSHWAVRDPARSEKRFSLEKRKREPIHFNNPFRKAIKHVH